MSDTRLGHTIKITPKGPVTITTNAHGTPRMTFRAEVHRKKGGSLIRTIVAMGRAHDTLADIVREGEKLSIRGFYDRMPANEDGSRGAEYVTAIGLPRAA